MNKYYTQISEIEKEIDLQHDELQKQWKNHGEIDGKSNIPDIEIESISPTEFSIRSSYQSIIHNLSAKGSQLLQSHKVEVHHIGSDLRNIDQNPKLIENQLNEIKNNYSTRLSIEKENHSKNIANIWQAPKYINARKEFEDSEAIFKKKSKELGRALPHKIGNWYWGLLIVIGFSELAYNFQAFALALSSSPFLTLVAALSVVIIYPVFAHFAGKVFKQFGERKQDIWLGVISVLIPIALTFFLSKWRVSLGLRNNSIIGLKQANEAFWLYFSLIGAIYFLGLILAFFAHDPSEEFTSNHKEMLKKKKKYDEESEAVHRLIQKEHNRNSAEVEKLTLEKESKLNEISNRKETLNKQFKDAISEYKKSVEYFQKIELKINANYKQTVNDYRVINLKYRFTKITPKAWENQPADLEKHFENLDKFEFTL